MRNTPLSAFIFALFLGLFVNSPATHAQEAPSSASRREVSNARFGFSFRYPEEFEEVPADAPGLGAALRKRGGGFPTITVTAHPGRFTTTDLSKEAVFQNRVNQIVTSYREVGLTDATLIERRVVPRGEAGAGADVLQLDIGYTREQTPFTARVAVLPGDASHFMVTYLDTTAHFAEQSASLATVLESFTQKEPLATPQKQRYPERERFTLILSGLVTLFALGFILWHHRKRTERAAVGK